LLLARLFKPTDIGAQAYVVRTLFLDKETNTYSLSKFQFYVWTLVAVYGYAYLTIAKNFFQEFPGLPALPAGLPGIVAIAAGTSVGAQVVTKINGPKGAGNIQPSLADFVTTGDSVAAERVQFFVWTLVGAFGFAVAIANLDPRVVKDLPEVPWSLISISGISAFGYLGGKLARNAGPVITEVVLTSGPDPDITAASGKSVIDKATAELGTAKANLAAVVASATANPSIAAAKATADAGDAAIKAAGAQQWEEVRKSVERAHASALEASRTLGAIAPAAPAGEKAEAQKAADAAMAADKAIQPLAATFGPFGVVELRGRTLSADGTFKISKGENSDPQTDVELSFDKLQPDPNSDKGIKRPRVIETDDTAKDDNNMAKRLRLVLSPDVFRASADVFALKSKHVIIVTNPDSQKVIFPFTVPETQKAA
jgi:hypothetical protein